MVRFLAPLVLLAALSGALYKTKGVWPKAKYDLENKGWDKEVAEDFVDMRKAVQKGLVNPRHGHVIMQSKWQGPKGGRMLSDEAAQQMVDEAVSHQQKAVAQRN